MPRMSALRPTPLWGLLLLLAGVAILLVTGLGTAHAATVTVRSGDTLGAIAARNGTTVAALARVNGIADPDVLAAGRRLTIPAGGSTTPAGAARSPGGGYTVRPGDTLGAIAARHGTTVAALAALNGLRDPDALAVGLRLGIPAGSPTGAAGSPTAPGEVAALLHRYAARHGVDPALARAIAWQESRWIQSARSSAGAIGVMQLMPATARWLGSDVLGRRLDPTHLRDNIEGGVAYLAWLQRQGADTRTTIGAYYQGLTAMRRRGPYDDTRDYIASVLSFRGRV